MKQTEMQGKKVYNIKFSGKDTYPKKKKFPRNKNNMSN